MSTPMPTCPVCGGVHVWSACPSLTGRDTLTIPLASQATCPDCDRKTSELVRLERRNRELAERLAKIREQAK